MSWRKTPFVAAIVVAGGITAASLGFAEDNPATTPAPQGQGMMGGQQGQGMMGGQQGEGMMRGQQGQGMMRMMMGQDGMGGMAMMTTAMSEHVEGRLAFLKAELKITDAQLPVWNNFAQAVRDNATATGSVMQGGMTGTNQSPTLPDKLAMREKMMSTHLEALRKLRAAVDPLYAALTDEQKKAADQLMPGPMGIMAKSRGPGHDGRSAGPRHDGHDAPDVAHGRKL